jgi:flagella basal body P-ring formation protein FlgA
MRTIQIIFSLLFCFFPATIYGLQITSLPMAEVTTDFVLLSDIVTFSEDSPLATALGTQRIANAPRIGKTITLQTRSIQKKLLKEFKLKNNLQWNGSSTTVIKRQGLQITPGEITASIDEYLHDMQDSLPEAEYSFVPRQLPLPFEIPIGDLEVKVIPSDPDIVGSKRFSLLYLVNDKTVKNISVRGQLKAMAPVAVLTRSVKRGSILHPNMVEMEMRNLSSLRSPCTDLRMVLGKKVSKRLRSGAVLDLSFIEFPPVIHKGQLVKMVVNHNGLQLSATGISYMNGKQDQVIRVKNVRSNKSVFCKVSSPGIVEVQI